MKWLLLSLDINFLAIYCMVIHTVKKTKHLINILILTNTKESVFYLFSEWDRVFFVCLFFFLSSFVAIPGWIATEQKWQIPVIGMWVVSYSTGHWTSQRVSNRSRHTLIFIRKWKVSVARKTAKTKSISILHLTNLFLEGVISMTLILVWKYIVFIFW